MKRVMPKRWRWRIFYLTFAVVEGVAIGLAVKRPVAAGDLLLSHPHGDPAPVGSQIAAVGRTSAAPLGLGAAHSIPERCSSL